MNIVALRGTLARPVTVRDLPDGAQQGQFQLNTTGEAQARSIPIVVDQPSATLVATAPGAELVVVGAVRSRFWRASGVTQRRTEVVARVVVPAHRSSPVARALDQARAAIS